MEQPIISSPLVIARLRPDKFPRISTLPKDDVIMILMEIISNAYLYKGYKLDEDNVKFISSALYDEMMQDNHHLGMPNISTFEIGYAIKKAVMDKEDFFFSVSYIYNIIKALCLKDGHEALVEAKKIIKAEQQKQIQSSIQPMLDVYSGSMVGKK